MGKIKFDRLQLKDLAMHLEEQDTVAWSEAYMDTLHSNLSVSEIEKEMESLFPELYFTLFKCSLRELPKEVNGPYKEVVAWRLSIGK